MDEKKYDALEAALTALTTGKEFTQVSTANPDLEAEIETAHWVNSLAATTIPAAAAHRSRSRVLARAMQLRQDSQSRWGFFHRLPRLAYALVLAVILLLSWNGLVTASAHALPGDQLYPAKLTLEKISLGLALNPQTHQKVEAAYQDRRIDEVVNLLALGRIEFVKFFGIVEQQWDDYWIIDGIEVRLLPETIILGEILPGMSVEVEGGTQPEGWVQASEIHLQNFSFIGTVEKVSETIWLISGREVLIVSASQIDQDLEVGDTVVVEVKSDDFGTLTARQIRYYNTENNLLPAIDLPTSSDDTQDTPELEDERDEDDSRDEAETPETEEPDESDEPKETDESGDIDEPDETDDSDKTDEQDETSEPKKTKEPDEADEPDEPDD